MPAHKSLDQGGQALENPLDAVQPFTVVLSETRGALDSFFVALGNGRCQLAEPIHGAERSLH